MTITTVVFDAYGTLFDVSAAARDAAGEPGLERLSEHWEGLAAGWRRKQLEYSWLRAVTGDHVTFWQVTEDALDWALEAEGMGGDDALRARLLELYRELGAYPEVPEVLAGLQEKGLTTAILSNGGADMLASATASAGIDDRLDAVLSADEAGVFKPDAAVYGLVGDRLGADRAAVLFVSSNGWDAGCAAAYGFRTVWVNRRGEPVDRLPGRPEHVADDLTGLVALTERLQ